MLPLPLMHRLVRYTVAGELPPVALTAAACWNADPESIAYVRSSANHIFRFSQGGAPCYLRLSPAPERSLAFLAGEVDWLRDLHARGLPVAFPQPSDRGAWIEILTDPADGLAYHAAAFAALPGLAWLEPEELTAAQRRDWGRLAARLHTAGDVFQPRPGAPRRPDWRARWQAAADSLPPDEPAARAVLAQGLAWLAETAASGPWGGSWGGPWGLIHGDLELDNLVWDGAAFAALDFDDCGYGPPAVDLALALRDVWAPPDGGPAAQEVLAAYAEQRPLPPDIAAQINFALQVESAVQFARLQRALAPFPDGDPPWVLPLRARLELRLAELRRGLCA